MTGDALVDIVGLAGTSLDVIAGRQDGTFDDPLSYRVEECWNVGHGLAIGDFNGDGRNDVAASVTVNNPGGVAHSVAVTSRAA